LLDLIQEGNRGLMYAINKFDPFRGIKLSYYASFWIKAHILKYIMDNWKLVRVGTTQVQRKLFYNLRREKHKLEAAGFKPDSEMLAKLFGVKENEVIEMDLRLGGWDVSINAPLKNDSDETHADYLVSEAPTPEDVADKNHQSGICQRYLEEFRKELPSRDACILDNRILSDEPETLEAIGKRLRISRERVRRREEKIKKELKEFVAAKMFVTPSGGQNFFDRFVFKQLLQSRDFPQRWARVLAENIWGEALKDLLGGAALYFETELDLAFALAEFTPGAKTLKLLELHFGKKELNLKETANRLGLPLVIVERLKTKALRKIANFPLSLLKSGEAPWRVRSVTLQQPMIKAPEPIKGRGKEEEEIGIKKGEGLTGIMSPTSAQILRELKIDTVSQLKALTSNEFIKKFGGKKYHGVTVKAVVGGMLENEIFLRMAKKERSISRTTMRNSMSLLFPLCRYRFSNPRLLPRLRRSIRNPRLHPRPIRAKLQLTNRRRLPKQSLPKSWQQLPRLAKRAFRTIWPTSRSWRSNRSATAKNSAK
jgi:alternative sigma factor RpoH